MAIASSTAENIEKSERFVAEVFNEHNLDVIDELVAENFVSNGAPGTGTIDGIEAYREYMRSVLDGFSDLTADLEVCFGQDDLVCSRTCYRGTHDGEFMGVPATGKEVEVDGITITKYEDGKMVESWANIDTLSLLQQVGVVDLPTA